MMPGSGSGAGPGTPATSSAGDEQGRTAEILRRLELTITRRLDGLLHGDHLGLVPGHGSELGETRSYVAGDDVRRIDWNVTARLQGPYVRATVADRELETWVVLDRSAAMDFGTARSTKADLALSAMAAFGFLTAHTGNRFGTVIVDAESERVVPARGGRTHLMQLLHRAATHEVDTDGRADLARSLQRLDSVMHRRGLVVVVSDFLEAETMARPLRKLGMRHEVLAVEIADPLELELPAVGALTLTDPGTGRTLRIDSSSQQLRDRYRAAAADQHAEIATTLRQAGVGHLQLRTDRDWVLDLVRYVALRRQRVAGPGAMRISR